MSSASLPKKSSCRIAFTTVSYNDRVTLPLVVETILRGTELHEHVTWYFALQACSPEFENQIVRIATQFPNVTVYKASFATNIGLSKAMSYLVEQTKYFEYTVNIEDDWILLQHAPKNWLQSSVGFLDKYSNITSVFLRAYANETDKWKYGWTRTIPYRNHAHQDNFNYEHAMKMNKHNIMFQDIEFQLIPNFLFSFNPSVVRNADFHKHVYPLPKFEKDQKTNSVSTNATAPPVQEDVTSIRKKKTNRYFFPTAALEAEQEEERQREEEEKDMTRSWGSCEAMTMERTRDAGLLTYWFKCKEEGGIFGHHEDFFPPSISAEEDEEEEEAQQTKISTTCVAKNGKCKKKNVVKP